MISILRALLAGRQPCRTVRGVLLLAIISIAGCASNTPVINTLGLKNEPALSSTTATVTASASLSSEQRYTGRISLVFEDAAANKPASFSGAFELRGQPLAGQLDLLTPLGSIAAQLTWQPGQALLIEAGQTRSFSSADALIAQATGTPISIQQLFDWLQGKANTSLPATTTDWQVDLSRHSEGRITASRPASPAWPQAATVRIILERP